MIGLIIWWVYGRNPLPAVMIAVGLVCSVTRSAWAGTAVAIPLLAYLMHQQKRFFLYATLALALFVGSIPILGLNDFLFFNRTGQDVSAESHRDQIANGLSYVAEHPFGSGNAKTSRLALREDTNANAFETTYPSFAAEYGIASALCFIACLLCILRLAWHTRSRLSYAAIGVLTGMVVVMAVTLPLDDRRLACWAFFPLGLAVQSAINLGARNLSSPSGIARGRTA
jgi:O-antigen ligase